MPRRPASVTQADIARAIRAAKQEGAESVIISLQDEVETPSDDIDYDLGKIYVVGFDSYVKIGFTTNLTSRVAALQTAVPRKLRLYATIDDCYIDYEKKLHKRYKKYRLEGEWFNKEGELAIWIEAGCPRDDDIIL